MEIVEKLCAECGEKIYIYDEFVREEMFCTIKCLNINERKHSISTEHIDRYVDEEDSNQTMRKIFADSEYPNIDTQTPQEIGSVR